MAPATRSSRGAKRDSPGKEKLTGMSVNGSEVKADTVAANPSSTKRGKAAAAKTVRLAATAKCHGSASTASTPAVSISNSGGDGAYSTPATSKAVTPAPSGSTNKQPSGGRLTRSLTRNRLVVVLPRTTENNVAYRKPEGFEGTEAVKRKRAQPLYANDDSEDDCSDDHPDAVLARRLQREEDSKHAMGAKYRPTSHKGSALPANPGQSSLMRPRRRLAVAQPAVVPDSEAEEDDSDDGDFAGHVRKGKGKAVSNTAAFPARRTSGKRKSDQVASEDEDDSDEPLSLSRPSAAHKKSKLRQGALSDSDFVSGASDFHGDSDSETGVAPASLAQQPPTGAGQQHNGSDAADAEDDLYPSSRRQRLARQRLEKRHPILTSMWTTLAAMPILRPPKADQPANISRQLKGFQLEGLAWMKAMERSEWKGGLLADEMGLGKTIQAVSVIMSDWPAKLPTLVLTPPIALMQWQTEIESYTDGKLKPLVLHGSNSKVKDMTAAELKKVDVILMSYNSLESMYRRQEKGLSRKEGLYKQKSPIHQIKFHRLILDEAHCVKDKSTATAKACFALTSTYRWCLSGTPLQNRIGELFSQLRFLKFTPFASYICRRCDCSRLEWVANQWGRCVQCSCSMMQHLSVFNQELLSPIMRYGNNGPGNVAMQRLRLLTDRIMLRRLKQDHTDSMDLPVKEIYVDRQYYGEVETDFARSIMGQTRRRFDTYVAQGAVLNNYANIFGLIMQMRQVADHPDLILKKAGDGGQNVLVCSICDEVAEEAIRSKCKHDFCRACARSYLQLQDQPDCPQCHIPLAIDLEQPEMEQDAGMVKKSSIINRIKMENWTSSSKIELLVHELHKLRSDNASHKSIIFSQFTTMLQLIEWRLRRAGITNVMLDGSMTLTQRDASIKHFMTNPDVECFLVSMKAGGVALNLTEASQVFIVDPWWNPAAEWQSADRCHRIGQTRPCKITRLCIEDSVESRMVELQEKKTNMIKSTVDSDTAALECLTEDDLQFLFRGN